MLAAIACLVAAATSYVPAMSAKHNVGLGVSSVEWMRQNGGNSLVSEIENWYYELNAPAKGGPALTSLREVGVTSEGEGSKEKAYRPPNVAPLVHPALAGEGVWKKAAAKAGPRPPVLLTAFRSDPEYPHFVAGVAWIDASRTHLAYVPGLAEPPEPLEHRGSGEAPPAQRQRLVATFNGGFPLETSNAGLIYRGKVVETMVIGIATIVEYRDGRVDVVRWRQGSDAPADVWFAKQNLPPIIYARTEQPAAGNAAAAATVLDPRRTRFLRRLREGWGEVVGLPRDISPGARSPAGILRRPADRNRPGDGHDPPRRRYRRRRLFCRAGPAGPQPLDRARSRDQVTTASAAPALGPPPSSLGPYERGCAFRRVRALGALGRS